MMLEVIRIVVIFGMGSTLAFNTNLELHQSELNDSAMLSEIIANFLTKYFSDANIFVSIITSPLEKWHGHFETDFFASLFDDPALTKFAHNFLNKLDTPVNGYRHAFNLILIADINVLPWVHTKYYLLHKNTTFSIALSPPLCVSLFLSVSLSLPHTHRTVLNESTVNESHLLQKFLIVLTTEAPNSTDALNGIFGILWTNGLINAHVLSKSENHSWILHTFMPYQQGCVTLTQLKVASFTVFNFSQNMELSFNELYPEKMRNFNWCPVYAVPSNTRPYVIHVIDSGGKVHYEGIDISIIDQIAKTLKMTIVYNFTTSLSSQTKLILVRTFFTTKSFCTISKIILRFIQKSIALLYKLYYMTIDLI